MNYKLVSIIGLFFFSAHSWGVDVSRCPGVITFKSTIASVVKDSIYSGTPGWRDAQKNLQNLNGFDARFVLSQKKRSKCHYRDGDNLAILSSASFHDPEERDPVLVNQLVIILNVDNSSFVTFVPLKSYALSGVETERSPFRVKIKAQLEVDDEARLGNFDMGMISLELK